MEPARKLMEPFNPIEDNERVRISNPPRRSPQINDGLKSPVRSVHPRMHQMESFQTHATVSSNMNDIFESSSDEGGEMIDAGVSAADVNLLDRHDSAAREPYTASHTEAAAPQYDHIINSVEPQQDGYQKLPASTNVLGEHRDLPAESPGTPFSGSVDEMLQESHFTHAPQTHSTYDPRSSLQSPRLAGNMPDTIEAYAIAHEITLQALMRDKEMLDRSLPASTRGDGRRATLQESFHKPADATYPKSRNLSMPPTSLQKRVHVLPTAIDTHSARRSLPAHLVRTPYPFSPDTTDRKDFGHESETSNSATSETTGASFLHLSIRPTHSNSRCRVTSLSIPASNEYTAVISSSPGRQAQHFKSMEFDDNELFLQLRKCYRQLMGPMRLISARHLSHIRVKDQSRSKLYRSENWSSQLSHSDPSFGSDNVDHITRVDLWKHYRKPRIGNAQYTYVRWVRRLAATTSGHSSQDEAKPEHASYAEEGPRRLHHHDSHQPDGLEFVIGWSVARIVLASAVVLTLSVAATLLWIFLGKESVPGRAGQGGFRDAGDRVTSGVLMGMCVLFLGLSSMAGWMGVSWLVM